MFVKQMIRHKLPDDSPRMLLETFVSMTRPDGMDISEWTSSCLLIVGLLLQQALLNLPAALAFSFWAGQITMPEWEASGITMPRTQTDIEQFDIAAFGRRVSGLNPRLFRRFQAKDIKR